MSKTKPSWELKEEVKGLWVGHGAIVIRSQLASYKIERWLHANEQHFMWF